MEVSVRTDDWLDKSAVQELVTRVTDAVTRGDWDLYESFWMDDAIWEESPPLETRVQGAQMIRKTVAAKLDAVDFFVQTAHGTVATLIDADHASARSTIHALARVGEHSFMDFGIYFDDCVKTDGGWKFARRRLQTVYCETDPLPGIVAISRKELQEIH